MLSRILILTGAAVFAVGGIAIAQSNDAAFIRTAAEGGMAEVQLGRLAEQKGATATVRLFGQRMVDEHTKGNEQLAAVARREGVMLPASLSPADRALEANLSSLSGAAFDRAYLNSQVTAHEKTAALLKSEIANGRSPAVVSWARDAYPMVTHHLDLATLDVTRPLAMASSKKAAVGVGSAHGDTVKSSAANGGTPAAGGAMPIGAKSTNGTNPNGTMTNAPMTGGPATNTSGSGGNPAGSMPNGTSSTNGSNPNGTITNSPATGGPAGTGNSGSMSSGSDPGGSMPNGAKSTNGSNPNGVLPSSGTR